MGFIKTVLILIVAFYVIGFIGRIVVPLFIKRQIRKFQQGGNNTYNKQKKEGEVTVNSKSKKNNLLDTSDAEYVDFEEVD